MRVFVLSTGRCGSMTLARACSHLSNFSAAHERNAGLHPREHLAYPDQHIESDNRLSWFLGPLAQRYPDARYVHLTRDPEAVARSYLKRWPMDPRRHRPTEHPVRWMRSKVRPQWRPGTNPGNGITAAFAYPLMARPTPWSEADRLDVVRYYVDTVESNIRDHLRDRPHVTIRLEQLRDDTFAMLEWIGAEGDLGAVSDELERHHNRS